MMLLYSDYCWYSYCYYCCCCAYCYYYDYYCSIDSCWDYSFIISSCVCRKYSIQYGSFLIRFSAHTDYVRFSNNTLSWLNVCVCVFCFDSVLTPAHSTQLAFSFQNQICIAHLNSLAPTDEKQRKRKSLINSLCISLSLFLYLNFKLHMKKLTLQRKIQYA